MRKVCAARKNSARVRSPQPNPPLALQIKDAVATVGDVLKVATALAIQDLA